ncbi:MAG: hypothetical protein LCH95_14865 [Proteobacteria bacterium]|nr:hypothetical protein [Pseudomonadota bacterium]
MSTYQMVAKHVEAALAEAAAQKIESEVVARYLLSEAVRVFKLGNRSDKDIAAELVGLAENLEDDPTYAFMRP